MTDFPPIFEQPGTAGPRSIKMPASRFSVVQNLQGFEVIDYDGRPVDELPSRESAEDVCVRLNEAATNGTLARALTRMHTRDTELSMYDESEAH